MRYVVVILFIVAVCVFCNALPNKCPKHPPCRPYGGCRIRKWRRVTSSMVHSTYRIGVALSYSQVRGGLRITGNVYHNGCGKGAGSGAVTYIKGDWTYIRYTQEFRGAASCWKIFGGPASPKYRNKEFAFYPNPYLKNPPNNVHDLDVKVGDGIFNELRMNTRSRNAFDGRVYRCDNEATNFWHGRNGGGLRSATVMLRRSNVRAKAGMLTETSCGTPTYVIKDIWVLM